MPLYKGIDLNNQPTTPTQTIPTPQPAQKKLFSGGFISDVADVLSVGQYATAGAARNLLGLDKGRGFFSSIRQGVRDRASFVDVTKELTPYEPSQSVGRNFVNELIRTGVGTALDVFLDPTVVLGKAGLVRKATSGLTAAGKSTLKTVFQNSPKVLAMADKIAPWVIRPSKLLPEYYNEEKTLYKAMNDMVNTEVGNIDKFLTAQKLTNAEQIRLAQVLEGGLTSNEKIGSLASRFRKEFDTVGAAIAKENPDLLNEETLKRMDGKYLRRLFKVHELEDDVPKFGFREMKVQGKTFVGRKTTEAERAALGEIKEAQPRIVRGLFEEKRDLNTMQFYNRLAKRIEQEVPQTMRSDLVYLSPQEYSKKEIGDLVGKYVPRRVAEDLEAQGKMIDPMFRQYQKAVRYWKIGKTALNPAATTRNILSNFLFQAPLAGVPPWRLDIYWDWMKEVKSNSNLYNKARYLGLEGSSYSSQELMGKVESFYRKNPKLLQKAGLTIKQGVDYAANFYGNIDQFFKGAAFYKGVVHEGLTPMEAMRKAQFYMIDYSDVPKAIDAFRKSALGAPFISFQYGISLPIAKTLLERPDKLAAYFKIIRGLQKINMDGRTEAQIQAEEGALPDYVKDKRETFVRLPWKDGKGKSQYLDLGYILPVNVTDVGGFKPLNGPLGNLIVDLPRNYNSFLGQPIWDVKDSPNEKITKAIKYLLPNLLPNTPFVPESISYNNFSKIGIVPRLSEGKLVFEPIKDKEGDGDEVLRTFLTNILGIKINAFDISEEAVKRFNERKFDIRDLKSEITRIRKNRQLQDWEKLSKIQKLQDKIRQRQLNP